MASLKDQVVVITGAAGGIGSATSKLFAEKGSKLLLSDMDQGRLDELVATCKTAGASEVFGIRTDVSVMADLEHLFKKTLEVYGKIDCLINNVGFTTVHAFQDITEEVYNSTMDVNMKAAFFITQLFIPELIKTKGTIVNLASAAAINPEPRFMAYSCAKAGINHFTKCLAREYAPKGIRVNSVNPGPVRTPFHVDHKALQKIADQQPLCGILEPEMIAVWVLFLASRECGPVTGQTIIVDGGRTVTRIPVGYGPQK